MRIKFPVPVIHKTEKKWDVGKMKKYIVNNE